MPRYRKSIAALLGALSTWGIASYEGGYSQGEWWALVGVVGTVVAVWGIPNDTPAGEAPAPGVSERGYGAVELVVGVLLVLILVVVLLRLL